MKSWSDHIINRNGPVGSKLCAIGNGGNVYRIFARKCLGEWPLRKARIGVTVSK
jgi:hypothetical protein